MREMSVMETCQGFRSSLPLLESAILTYKVATQAGQVFVDPEDSA